jgi:hypothetical protein
MHPMQVKPQQPLRGEIVEDAAPQDKTLAGLDFLSYVMDRLLEVPGLRLRVGLNTLLMLVPLLGDAVASLVSFTILYIGLRDYRVPRIVAARMVVNSLLDASLGWVPVLGDLFDVFFKADTRNVRLLQAYAGRGDAPPHATWRHWVFVVGVAAAALLVLVLLVLGSVSLIHWLVTAIRGG